MQPEEERRVRGLTQPVFIEPLKGMSNAVTRFASYKPNVFLLKYFGGKRVVVKIEAACQSPTAIQDKRANHRGRGIALLLEHLSDRLEALIERLPGEILYAILKWVGAGQDGCMRRPSERHLRDGMLEDNPVASQGVQCWRLDVRRTIAAEVIGAYRING